MLSFTRTLRTDGRVSLFRAFQLYFRDDLDVVVGSNPTITPREKFPLDKYTTKDGIIRFERFTAIPGQYETTLYPKQKTKNVKIVKVHSSAQTLFS
jgi:hypothetical protein